MPRPLAAAPPVTIHGHHDPRWTRVRDAFAAGFASGDEWGASLAVWHAGELVVDLWGGMADVERQRPWQADTLTTVFSCTKALVALAFLMLNDRGQLDYDAPVARYWPGFGTHGKERITVRTLLNHRAGLHGLDGPVTLDDIEQRPEQVTALLERQSPRWTPGQDQGYHAVTYGLYADVLFRRIAGESIGTFLRREVTKPLGADAFLGLPVEYETRVATNYPVTTRERLLRIIPKAAASQGTEGRVYRSVMSGGDAARAFAYPRELGPAGIHNFNTRRVHAMELPWGNGIANGRGLCRVFAALANGGELDGVQLVRAETIEPVMRRQGWSERDRVLNKPIGWSQGFLKEGTAVFSPNTESFGHSGAGGALAWADPVARVSIGYAMNKMDHMIRSPRALALCHAVYECVGPRR
ncbi:MAG: beta-lactamase family protein [Sandaracinaceae bacterium]|jgi:CubicO group peptidase (beta-lactamase class C family)|nr:beta-lactamase family protein [Sandaracinaceae bacterium]MBP7681564.1 beta-lactamase family protein [Deltaproteobacteria bacterium]MBK6808710.1 beta-lactamase family protein [Sandaracinaceae bacterium]MBK7150280.1 beta-lactamase family protein [Sandaracinaceae bacterium]MBK7774346.1 beta-lactamase family protein [Sandaracinaceae bacterium]